MCGGGGAGKAYICGYCIGTIQGYIDYTCNGDIEAY